MKFKKRLSYFLQLLTFITILKKKKLIEIESKLCLQNITELSKNYLTYVTHISPSVS